MVSRIEDGVYKTLRLPIILLVEHGVVVMTVGSESGEFQFKRIERQFSILNLCNLCSESVGL